MVRLTDLRPSSTSATSASSALDLARRLASKLTTWATITSFAYVGNYVSPLGTCPAPSAQFSHPVKVNSTRSGAPPANAFSAHLGRYRPVYLPSNSVHATLQPMRELLQSHDLVLLSAVKAALAGAAIPCVEFDAHMADLYGNVFARRIMVDDDDLRVAQAIVKALSPEQISTS
ncbi:MAG: hypothetical protein EXQ84_05815 [Rhodospirillaceae bacterium]|nr:hypothetical protein [Rhodospirillaceae bacterium]